MSRSYKKTPVCKSCGYGGYGKRLANKKTRRVNTNTAYKGGQYRKLYDTWDINDYIVFYPKSEAMKNNDLNNWRKWFYRK